MVQLTFKRYEIKYLLTHEQQDRLRILMDLYMTPDEWGPSTVCNVYCDTPTNLLVRRSAEHPMYKEKVRVRSYGVRAATDPVFVELKKKYDGVVYKRRCTLDAASARDLIAGRGTPSTQIERELDYTCRRYGGLEPSLFVAYDREAFYAKDDHEFRMTCDRRVRYRTHDLRLDARCRSGFRSFFRARVSLRCISPKSVLPTSACLSAKGSCGACPTYAKHARGTSLLRTCPFRPRPSHLPSKEERKQDRCLNHFFLRAPRVRHSS